MNRLLFIVYLFSTFSGLSQTGPAGVGTSATNVFWLKADAGTTSSVNATAISAWNDQSGNNINMSQTVAIQQPSFATNVINGFPAIQFDNVAVAGQNDKMIGPDSPLLDNTAGYTFFTVSRPQNLAGLARAIVSKRTTVSVDQSFMLFYYISNKFNVDIQTTDNRFASNMTFNVNTDYIIDLVYDGTLPSATRCNLYSEETLDITAAETNSLVPDNASPIIIGTTDASDSRPFGGYISEVIIYRQALTSAPKIIVDNYLSAKYNVALSANDKYQGDTPANGNFDQEVAGIGQESTGSNPSFSASISGGLTISANSGLDNTDYALAGHASPTNYQITTDVGGLTGTNNARWLRIWYIDVTNTLTSLNTTIEFDMSDGGIGPIVLGPASDYVLIYRPAQTGNWTEVATASSIVGDRVIFSGYTLSDDGYYTIGTKNYLTSPLPINLVSFTAEKNGDKVRLNWCTANEKNNDQFIVQKTKDGMIFEDVVTIQGAGNNSSVRSYTENDYRPYAGTSYYRLAQKDADGQIKFSALVPIDFQEIADNQNIAVYQDQVDGNIGVVFSGFEADAIIDITDMAGKKIYATSIANIINNKSYFLDTQNKLIPGVYLVSANSGDKICNQKIIIK